MELIDKIIEKIKPFKEELSFSSILPETTPSEQLAIRRKFPFYITEPPTSLNHVVCQRKINSAKGISEIHEGVKYFISDLYFDKKNITKIEQLFKMKLYSPKKLDDLTFVKSLMKSGFKYYFDSELWRNDSSLLPD